MLLSPDLAYSFAIGASLQLADIRFSIMYHIKRFLIHKTGFNTHLVPQKRFMWYQIIILSNLSGDRPVFPGRFSDSAINCHGSRRRSVPVRSGVFTSSAARGTCAVESFAVAHPSQQSWAPSHKAANCAAPERTSPTSRARPYDPVDAYDPRAAESASIPNRGAAYSSRTYH